LATVELESHLDVTFSTVDLPNGESRELKADVLRPATGERLPLVLFLPGGAFLRCNKAMAVDLRRHVAESGFVVASVEYRVTPDGATYMDSVHDVRAALVHLRQHADDFGIDPRTAALWGESAGGHVAALTGVTNELPEFSGHSGTFSLGTVQAVVDAFGTSLLSAIADDFDEEARLHYERTATHFSAYVGKAGALFSEIPEAVSRCGSRNLRDGFGAAVPSPARQRGHARLLLSDAARAPGTAHRRRGQHSLCRGRGEPRGFRSPRGFGRRTCLVVRDRHGTSSPNSCTAISTAPDLPQ
jgi:hypothetical protein